MRGRGVERGIVTDGVCGWGALLALQITVLVFVPWISRADAGDEAWDDGEPEKAVANYEENVGYRFLTGLNSVLTFPADPVMSTIHPLEEFDSLPGAVVTRYFLGLGQGTLLGVYRLTTGALDIAFAIFTPFATLSPEPRYRLFEGVEHEEY
jgi:hypothetical protein